MFINKLMKNPILVIGILLFIIFIYDLKSRKSLLLGREKLYANSCRSTLVMLNKRIPESWNVFCEGNNVAAQIPSELKDEGKDDKQVRNFLYRELANHLIFISKNTPEDSLKNVMIVRLKLSSYNFDINAVTEGKYLVKFRHMERTKFIAQHLKSTVQIQEIRK